MALAFVASLLQFLAEEAPHLVDEVRKLVTTWADRKGIPHEVLLAALGPVDDRVKAVDTAVNQHIAELWGDQTQPDGSRK
jgi:hypothetical protein